MKVGDKVKLKSGSPIMTVYDTSNNMISCVYFVAEEGKFKKMDFVKECLVLVN